MTRLLTFLFCIICLSLKAQNPYTISYTLSDGLPSTNVYSVFQDENGLVWFTTDVGIVKYDSKTFELLNTDNGLSDNEVFKLNKDSKGRVWMRTLNGKPSFIYQNKIYNETNSTLLQKIKGTGLLTDFFEDKQQNIYLTFRNGEICKIDKHNKISNKRFKNSSLAGVWEDGDLYTISTEAIFNLNKNIKSDSFSDHNIFRTYHSNKHTFVSDKNEIYIVRDGKLIPYLSLSKGIEIINLYEEAAYMWVCTKNGLFQFKNKILYNHFFEEYLVSDILKDNESNYWITSLNKGVLLIPSIDILQILKNTKINCLARNNKNELWIGGFENDYYIKSNNQISVHYLPKMWLKDKISNFRFFGEQQYILGKSGMRILNNNSQIQNIKVNSNDLLIRGKHLFIATSYITKIDLTKHPILDPFFIINYLILSKRTNVLCNDNDGNVWIGTNFGLHCYTKNDSIINLGEKYPDLSISIEDIFYDSATKTLLVATASNGVVILKNNRQVGKINTLKGLNNNTVNTIKKINAKRYLIGTNNGVNEVQIKQKLNKIEIRNYNTHLGIKNKKIKDIEAINDTIYLATDNGVLYFQLKNFEQSSVKPQCNIISVKTANGSNVSLGSSVEYNKNDLSISINGISFKDQGDITFYYKLTPQDKTWTKTKETQINFKSLPANDYQFQAYCVNGFGNKSDIKKYSFEILPPFWERKWFQFLGALLLISSIYSIVRYRFKKQQLHFEKENQKIQIERDNAKLEKQMVELEQKALRMQMNPHFIFNALNTIKGYYSEGNDVKASSYISKFSKLLRMLLENEDQNTSLENEIEMLQLYIELTKIRYQDKFDFEILSDSSINISDTLIPNLLLQPLVENAIIHGLAPLKIKGKLLVQFIRESEFLICIVEDNGIGRANALKNKKNTAHESKAISIVKDRLKLFSNYSQIQYIDLEDNGKPLGTRVVIKFPIKNIW